MGDAQSFDSYIQEGVLIDVRSKEEYDDGHIEGAIHIPHNIISEKIGSVVADKEKTINLYCAGGVRAGSAKSTLLSLGYKNVANLGGYSTAKSKVEKEVE